MHARSLIFSQWSSGAWGTLAEKMRESENKNSRYLSVLTLKLQRRGLSLIYVPF